MSQPTSAQSGPNVLRRAIDEVINAGRLELIDELFHPDFIDHDVFPNEGDGNRASFRSFLEELRAALPDLRFERQQDEVIAGNQIWCWYMASGTMTGGPLFGKPPTGRFARWREVHCITVDAATGQIISHIGAGDDRGMLSQLGVIEMF